MLEVKGLSCVRNEQEIFRQVNFVVESGAALQICAANGTGKTSLLKILAGIIKPATGKVLWQQNNIKINLADYRNEIFFLSHKHNLHPLLTPLENLYFLSNLTTNQSIGQAQILKALQFMQIAHKAQVACAELSAGQLQRISVASLFFNTKKIWLLDEPFTNLDAEGKELVLHLCAQHLHAAGIILVATHHEFLLPNFKQYILYLENYV